jgi:hypothetical protein
MCKAFGLFTLVGALTLSLSAYADAGKVTFLEGKAFHQAQGGEKVALAMDAAVQEHDKIITGDKARLELTLADGSVLRFGPSSEAELTTETFSDQGRQSSTKLMLGNIWAKVKTSLGGDDKFEVKTDRAVAGVRGTTFRVDAHKDNSAVVKVFAGAVAVAGVHIPITEHTSPMIAKASPADTTPTEPSAGSAPSASAKPDDNKAAPTNKAKKHVLVQGPQQVTQQQWEKIVGAQMKVVVAADGSLGEPEKFAEADECADAWTRWNRERDGDPCPSKHIAK